MGVIAEQRCWTVVVCDDDVCVAVVVQIAEGGTTTDVQTIKCYF